MKNNTEAFTFASSEVNKISQNLLEKFYFEITDNKEITVNL